MLIIINKVLSIFLIAGLGFIAARTGILPKEANNHIVNLLMKLICPCMIFSAVLSHPLEADTLSLSLSMLFFSLLFFIGVTLLSYLVCVKIMGIKPSDDAGIYMICMATINNGFIGFPVTLALFGNDILFLMVFFQEMLLSYCYSVGILQVNYGMNGKCSSNNLLSSLKNVSTIVSVIALAMLFLNITLPEFLMDTATIVGDATVPISMIVVGMQLGNSNIVKIIKNKELVIISVLKMLFLPLLTFLAVNWLPIDMDLKIALVFGSAFPSAVVTVPIASMENRNSVLAAEMVSFTTLLSILTLPVVAVVLKYIYGLF